MPPQRCGPVSKGFQRAELKKINVTTSWRPVHDGRLMELDGKFRGGDFGMSVQCTVSIVSVNGTLKLDEDGNYCLQDGRHTVSVLLEMEKDLRAAKDSVGAHSAHTRLCC